MVFDPIKHTHDDSLLNRFEKESRNYGLKDLKGIDYGKYAKTQQNYHVWNFKAFIRRMNFRFQTFCAAKTT